MRFFSRKAEPQSEASTEEFQCQTFLEGILASLRAAFTDISRGKYQSFSCPDPDLSSEVQNFSSDLAQKRRSQVQKTVDLSMQINESVIYGAEIYKAGREIKDRSSGMAAAVQELTASIAQISKNTQQVAEESQNMRNLSRKGMTVAQSASSGMHGVATSVEETVQSLGRLRTAADEITGVVGFISDIAEQTNLLALNATIEAARAGDAGKGFAVVAHEVKELANKTAENAKQIIERIKALEEETQEIDRSVQSVVRSVDESEVSIQSAHTEMGHILETAEEITERTQEIAGILTEQEIAANEVADGVGVVADMAQENIQKIHGLLDLIDDAEALLVSQLQDCAGEEVPDLTVLLAKSDHIIWKKRLVNMLVGRGTLDPETLSDHHSCRLGKWCSTIKDPRYTEHPAYKELEAPHALVHRHGIAAAKKYKDGDLQGAIAEVREVEKASVDVIRLLDSLAQGSA